METVLLIGIITIAVALTIYVVYKLIKGFFFEEKQSEPVGSTSTTTTSIPNNNCLHYIATGEASQGTRFWYYDCDGIYQEKFLAMNERYSFSTQNKLNQYSIIDVTISSI